MKKQGRYNIDVLNLLKYFMVLVFIVYIAVLLAGQSADDVPVKKLETEILKATGTDGMKKGTTQDLKRYYGLNAQDYEGAVLYIPDDVMSVSELLILRLKDESQAEAAEAAAEERLETQKKSFEGYGASQTGLLNGAILTTRGNYVLLTVSPKADQALAAFENSL
ncbi:DUF4358 domain-containing protein [uncultured Merdimonas sp.]|uniref:DUF4358 domain-containing protein n=1 Tax=uncultured Merdimonas sp. TaxID=2023269 RepID=UPI00320B8C0D